MVKYIAQLKKIVDSFNFFLQTNAGIALLTLIGSTVLMVGTTLFFTNILSLKLKGQEFSHIINDNTMLYLGVSFAIILELMIYAAPILRLKFLSYFAIICSGVLSICSYGDIVFNGNMTFYNISAVVIVCLFPVIAVATLSHRLAAKISDDMSELEQAHKDLDKYSTDFITENIKEYTKPTKKRRTPIKSNTTYSDIQTILND